MAKLKIFFAYQFAGARFNRIEREARYTHALEAVNSALQSQKKSLQVSWRYWDIESGSALSKEIFDRMDEADLFVFDLSDNNRNVLIELGYALRAARSSQREVIILTHHEHNISEIPSDLAGVFLLRVSNENLQQRLTHEIYNRIERVLTPKRIIRDILAPCSRDGIHLICPEIPEALRSRHAATADMNYLRYLRFADLDTLFYVRSKIAAHYPEARVSEFTASEYFLDSEAMQIVIGGPAWNRMAKLAQRGLPVQFADGGDGQDDPAVEAGGKLNSRFLPNVEDGLLLSDISYVAKLSRGQDCKILMLSGCRTPGVLGAAKSLLDESVAVSNSDWLSQRCQENDFVLVFRSVVVSGGVIAEALDECEVLSLHVKHDRQFTKVL